MPGVPNAHSHHGRNRRAPRLSMSQNAQRQHQHQQQHQQQQFRSARSMKDMPDTTALLTFRNRFEATKSFDLEDDLEFCPNLLTDSDLVSIHSASERSSLASISPDSSPTQQPQTVAPAFSLNSSSPPFVPPSAFQSQHSAGGLKLHQPAATRGRNAIPIVNPATGAAMASPSPSVSPGRMQHIAMGRRW